MVSLLQFWCVFVTQNNITKIKSNHDHYSTITNSRNIHNYHSGWLPSKSKHKIAKTLTIFGLEKRSKYILTPQ